MKKITATDLQPWREPLDLIAALVDLPREQLSDLRESLHQLIHHADRDVRTHAVRRLFVHLKDREFHHDALDLLLHDPDSHVRRVAAFAVASTSSEESRVEDIRSLLHTLCNEDEERAVRGAAYEGLLLINGRRDFPPVKRDIDFLRDVDWDWVAKLRSGARS